MGIKVVPRKLKRPPKSQKRKKSPPLKKGGEVEKKVWIPFPKRKK